MVIRFLSTYLCIAMKNFTRILAFSIFFCFIKQTCIEFFRSIFLKFFSLDFLIILWLYSLFEFCIKHSHIELFLSLKEISWSLFCQIFWLLWSNSIFFNSQWCFICIYLRWWFFVQFTIIFNFFTLLRTFLLKILNKMLRRRPWLFLKSIWRGDKGVIILQLDFSFLWFHLFLSFKLLTILNKLALLIFYDFWSFHS